MTTKTDDQERAAFEAWYVAQTTQDRDWWGWEEEHCQYGMKHTRLSWAAWQARAVVEADRQGRMPSDDLHTLQSLLAWSEAQICMHEETHRGGTNWEICDQCGAKWADDEGGKPEFQWPEPIVKASALLSRYGSSQPAASDWRTEIYNIANNIGEALSGATEQTIVDAVSPYVDQLFALYSQPAASPEGSPADAIGFESIDPDDRFFHASDKSWWRRGDDGMLIRAEAPQPAASSEVAAWRERFPAYEYRPQDECVALKLSTPAASAEVPVYKDDDDFNQNASTAELGAWQRGWNACRAEDAASGEPCETEALRDMLDDARSDLEMLRNALGVPVEPHQNLLERMLDAAKVAAPVAQEPVHVTVVAEVIYTADGKQFDWALEGGIAELEVGDELIWAERPITGDNGKGTVYIAPVAAQPGIQVDVQKMLRRWLTYGRSQHMARHLVADTEAMLVAAPTPPAVEQASIQQWPSDWADQLNGEYRQGLEDGRKEAQLSGNPVQLVSVQVDKSSNLQGSPVDKSTEMQDQLSAQDREDAESILLGTILSDWHNRGETGDVDGG